MLDKLSLVSGQTISLDEAKANLKGFYSNITLSATKYHSLLANFSMGGDHLITLHLDPRFSHVAPTKIEINPSRHPSHSEMTKIIGLIADPSTIELSRVDHAVDLENIKVEQVQRSLLYSRKKSREVYRNCTELTGFYLGKHPELLAIYDKAKQAGLNEIKTRIELRQYREKLPINKFSELSKLQSFSPFSCIRFNRVSESPCQSLREKQRRDLLSESINDHGLQATYKLLNRHSNFKRDLQSSLEPDPAFPDLNQIYQQNLRTFFQGGS